MTNIRAKIVGGFYNSLSPILLNNFWILALFYKLHLELLMILKRVLFYQCDFLITVILFCLQIRTQHMLYSVSIQHINGQIHILYSAAIKCVIHLFFLSGTWVKEEKSWKKEIGDFFSPSSEVTTMAPLPLSIPRVSWNPVNNTQIHTQTTMRTKRKKKIYKASFFISPKKKKYHPWASILLPIST